MSKALLYLTDLVDEIAVQGSAHRFEADNNVRVGREALQEGPQSRGLVGAHEAVRSRGKEPRERGAHVKEQRPVLALA